MRERQFERQPKIPILKLFLVPGEALRNCGYTLPGPKPELSAGIEASAEDSYAEPALGADQSAKVELALSENTELAPDVVAITALKKNREWWHPGEVWARSRKPIAFAGALVTAALMLPSDVQQSTPYEPASLHIAHDNNVCPPDSDFGILHMSGVGMSSIGIHSSYELKEILGEEIDECEAASKYGSEYSITNNAHVLHEFIVSSGLNTIVVFAHSFGGIAAIDMLNEYESLYPNSKINFAVVFVSSPGEVDDLHFGNWVGAHVLNVIPLTTEITWFITLGGILSQEGKEITDQTVYEDTDVCAKDAPPTLVKGEVNRFMGGMNALSGTIEAPMVLIGDEADSVVNMRRSARTIPRRVGRPVKFVTMSHSDARLNNHADLWWRTNRDAYRRPVRIALADSLGPLELKHLLHKNNTRSSGRVTRQP